MRFETFSRTTSSGQFCFVESGVIRFQIVTTIANLLQTSGIVYSRESLKVLLIGYSKKSSENKSAFRVFRHFVCIDAHAGNGIDFIGHELRG